MPYRKAMFENDYNKFYLKLKNSNEIKIIEENSKIVFEKYNKVSTIKHTKIIEIFIKLNITAC